MFTPAHVDANVVYLNDRTNPDLLAVGDWAWLVAGCLVKKWIFRLKAISDVTIELQNSIVHTYLLIFFSYIA